VKQPRYFCKVSFKAATCLLLVYTACILSWLP
jgi:hypothetical protein